jgi:hypothetical protein
MDFSVSLQNFAKSLEAWAGGDNFKERAYKGLVLTTRLHAPRVLQEEISRASPVPVDRGTYRRSWQVIENRPALSVSLVNATSYAAVIELGRRAGAAMPPLDAIAGWVRRKHLARGKKEINDVAFAVARAISRRGLPGHFILNKTLKKLVPIIQRGIVDALGRP